MLAAAHSTNDRALCCSPDGTRISAAAPLLSLSFHLKLFIYLGPVANAELTLNNPEKGWRLKSDERLEYLSRIYA